MLVTAQLALAQTVGFLPPSLSKRGLLGALAIIPIMGLLQVNRMAIWKAEVGPSSHGGDDLWIGTAHPILALAAAARSNFSAMLQKQPRTLPSAVVEYKSRYNRSPPPGFDAWFRLAIQNDFIPMDEFDMMMESPEPFWGLPPLESGHAGRSQGTRSVIKIQAKELGVFLVSTSGCTRSR